MGRRQWQPTPVLLPGKSHGRRSLVGCSPWGREESDTTERLHFHFSLSCIGEGNGNPLQCSCLENPRDGGAWWAAIYGVTQSWSHRAGHDWSDLAAAAHLCEQNAYHTGWATLKYKQVNKQMKTLNTVNASITVAFCSACVTTCKEYKCSISIEYNVTSWPEHFFCSQEGIKVGWYVSFWLWKSTEEHLNLRRYHLLCDPGQVT